MSGYGGQYDELSPPSRAGSRKPLPTALKFLAALVLLVVLDALWIQLITQKVLGIDYFDIVQKIQNGPVAWRWQGLLAYLVLGYAAAFMTEAPTPEESALEGARIGFVIYSIFDFTTTFMFNGWTLKVAVLDTIWGTLMYTIIGYTLSYLTSTSWWQRL